MLEIADFKTPRLPHHIRKRSTIRQSEHRLRIQHYRFQVLRKVLYRSPFNLKGASMNSNIPPPLDTEIESRFQQAGLVIPADLKAGAISEARSALSVTFWLRQPRTAAVEPSNTFSLVKGARS
jgi:hypothetical protein